MIIKKDLKIGEKFRVRHEGNVFQVVLVYNRLDEDFPYAVVNLNNWEVMDSYSSVDKIEVCDIFLELNQRLINNATKHKDTKEEYVYTYEGRVFNIYNPLDCLTPWKRSIFEEGVDEDEGEKLKMLCELYGIKEDGC